MIGSFVASAVTLIAGLAVLETAPRENCDIGSSDFDTCLQNHERDFHDALVESTVILGAGILIGGVGLYIYAHPHPVDENEAKALADDYNQDLRKQLGLPTATRHRPRLRDVAWTPYVTGHQAGLAFSTRF